MVRTLTPLAMAFLIASTLSACNSAGTPTANAAGDGATSSTPAADYQPPFISAQEARARKDLRIGDVRPAEAFKGEHIEGAENLPFSTIATWQAQMDKTQPLAVYCTCVDDGLSIKTARTLHTQYGFTQVFVLHEGLAGWKSAGLPTVK